MVKGNLGHLQVNVHLQNKQFYKDLFDFLGWKVLYDDENMLGVGDEHDVNLWFNEPIKKAVANDYDGIGTNHIAISVPRQADVDEAVAFLKQHQVAALFDTPRHRPEFCDSKANTCYQVMFESPDHILFEIVYMGPKQG
jgi:catechol 2,3-dioxygenase-like lactoylglutathione lyase family enzyme